MKFNLCSLSWHNKKKFCYSVIDHPLPSSTKVNGRVKICFTRETDLLENKFRTQNEQDLYFPALRIRKIRSFEVPV